MVLCEVEVWAKFKPHKPSAPTCDGCAWRLKACEAGQLDHWDVDYAQFSDTDGALSGGSYFSSGFVDAHTSGDRVIHTYAP